LEAYREEGNENVAKKGGGEVGKLDWSWQSLSKEKRSSVLDSN